MRSEKHATFYRVGSLAGRDVYWNPSQGYAVKRDFEYLGVLEDLSQVAWFDRHEDLDKIVSDLGVSNGQLATAIVGELYGRILDAVQDAAIADEAEAEKESTLRQGSGVY